MPHVKGDQNSNETVPFRTIRLSQMIFDLTQLPARNSSKEEREKKGPKCNRKNPSEAIPKLQNLNYDYFKDCDVKKRRRRTKKKKKKNEEKKRKLRVTYLKPVLLAQSRSFCNYPQSIKCCRETCQMHQLNFFYSILIERFRLSDWDHAAQQLTIEETLGVS